MVEEGTPGKYSLRAVEPRSRRPLVESYATREEVATRRAALEDAGFNVLVTLPEMKKTQREGDSILIARHQDFGFPPIKQ